MNKKTKLAWLKTQNENLAEWDQKDRREDTQSPKEKKKLETDKDLSLLSFKSISPFREALCESEQKKKGKV